MITNIDIDMFKQECDAYIHSCNCLTGCWGGLAGIMRRNYPEAYDADLKTAKSDPKKLGTYSVAQSKKDGRYIYNLYGQFNVGVFERQTNYEAFYIGLEAIKNNMVTLGLKSCALPKFIGSALGGANYSIIEKMIEVVFENSGIDVYICNYDPTKPVTINNPSVDDVHWYGN